MESIIHNKRLQYYAFFGFAQACGLTSFFLLIHIISTYATFDWNILSRFYLHPFFMFFGMVYFQGTSISAFRVLNDVEKIYVKYVHAGLHTITFVFTVVGLCAVFDFNNLYPNYEHLTSFHGILGIITTILFSAQWFFSFLGYLYPKAPENYRAAFMPYHRACGLICFTLAVINTLIGLNMMHFEGKHKVTDIWISILLLLFGMVTVIITMKKIYKRDNE